MINRLRLIQVNTTILRHSLSQYQHCSSSSNKNNNRPESQPMRWSKTWIGCGSAPRLLLLTPASLGPPHRMVIRMKSRVLPLPELQLVP